MAKTLSAMGLFCLISAYGQTQIDLDRQGRNALPYTLGGTNATTRLEARKNVGTPHLVATDMPGSDIGAQVNSAFASFPAGTCGTVLVPASTYLYSTTIYVPVGCILSGVGRGNDNGPQGTKLVYNGAPATPAIAIMKPDGTRSDWASVRDLSIYSNANVCPNSGMLTWNPAASGSNKWQCYDGTSYTTPIPHLAGILHGQIDPTVLGDGTHITVTNVDIDGGVGGGLTQGAFHFGVWFNGGEEVVLQSVYSLFADEGFFFGPFTQPALMNQISARINRRAGIHVRGFNGISCHECIMESNFWWGHQGADPQKYGAGLRLDYENLSGFGSTNVAGLTTYSPHFENNDIDILSPAGVAAGLVRLEGFSSIRGAFGYSSSLKSCTVPDASQVTIAGDLYMGCGVQAGSFNYSSGNLYTMSTLGDVPLKINRPDTSGGPGQRVDFYEMAADNAGNPATLYVRGLGSGPNNTHLQLQNPQASTSATNRDSPVLQFEGTKWNGVSSTAYDWYLHAQAQFGFGAPESTSGLYVNFNDLQGGGRRFVFRENGDFRVLQPNGQVTIGDQSTDNSTPALNLNYQSNANTTGGHIAANWLAGGVPHAGDGNLFWDAATVTLKGATNPTLLVVQATPGQSTDLQRWKTSDGNVRANIRADGSIQSLPFGSQPGCDSSTRGTHWFTQGLPGVKDSLQICAKDASDVYAWRAIY